MTAVETAGQHPSAAFAARLSRWLGDAGFPQPDIAVDFVDVIDAAAHIQELLVRVTELGHDGGSDADQALACLGEIEVWLFGEMKHHLRNLERAWPALQAHLERLAPDDEES